MFAAERGSCRERNPRGGRGVESETDVQDVGFRVRTPRLRPKLHHISSRAPGPWPSLPSDTRRKPSVGRTLVWPTGDWHFPSPLPRVLHVEHTYYCRNTTSASIT